MTETIIAWDLGATKCAAAVVEYDNASHHFRCKQDHTVLLQSYKSLDDLIDALEAGLGIKFSHADAICIGAAGHFDGENLSSESGYPYPMPFAKTAKQRDWPKLAVIHDYAPIVCATFTSYIHQPENVRRLNACKIPSNGRRVALGIGTGLGLKDGVLFENGDFWLGKNEIGHIGIPTPPSISHEHHQRHHELIKFLASEDSLKPGQPVTFEKILSGLGTVRLYQFCYPNNKDLTPEQIGEKFHNNKADEALKLFSWYLGLLIGTVELTFMPECGIWITGGVILKNLNVFDHPDFFHGIEASPAYATQRKQIPLGVLCNHEHAFMGGAYYASRKLL